jgi:hypothetical protein
MCLAALNHELIGKIDSIINSFVDLFCKITKAPPSASHQKINTDNMPFKINSISKFDNDVVAQCYSGFELGDPLKAAEIYRILTDRFSSSYTSPYFFKGYVYRRMMDFIIVMEDRELAAKMASALKKSLNFSIANPPD